MNEDREAKRLEVEARVKELEKDADRFDWLERAAMVDFEFDRCIISFEFKSDDEGFNSVREIIDQAMNAAKETK